MEYKVGDKVRIKTWEELKLECGGDNDGIAINPPSTSVFFAREMEKKLKEEFSNRILIIKDVNTDFYHMEDFENWAWKDYMIRGLAEDEVSIIYDIADRFELMDFE